MSITSFNPESTSNLVPEFGNQFLRFGQSADNDNVSVALNGQSGSLYGPEYFDGEEWKRGTYNRTNFGIGLGIGGDGTDPWNQNGSLYRNDYYSIANASDPNSGGGNLFEARKGSEDFLIDTSDLTDSTGSFTWTGFFEFADPEATDDNVEVKLSRTYTLADDSNFVKETTVIENIDPQSDALTNVRLWLGVGDDYIGDDDRPDKIKGNIIDGVFTPISSLGEDNKYEQESLPSVRANAILVSEGYPGLSSPITEEESNALNEFFFTNSSSGYAIVSDEFWWDFESSRSALYYDPQNSESFNINDDGSYAIYYRLPDIAAGDSRSVDTYFAMSPVSILEETFDEVFDDATPTPEPAPEPAPTPRPTPIRTSTPSPTPPTADNSFVFTEFDDTAEDQKNFDYKMLRGDDLLEVVGGDNNVANGNQGDDRFIILSGNGTYRGGKDRDTFEISQGSNNTIYGDLGEDNILITGGEGFYSGGDDNDRIEVIDAEIGTQVNGNRGEDTITGVVAGVIYRGGKDNDLLEISQGEVWGDQGTDTFRGIAGDGFAVIQDYTIGEDVVELAMDGSWSSLNNGLMFTDQSDEQIMFLVGITTLEQVTLV